MKTYYEKQIRKLDRNLSMTDPAAYAAAMLLCGAAHGANVNEVAARTEVPIADARAIGKRLRTNGIWRGVKTCHSGWDDPKTGGIAFWMDVAVGTGMMMRARKQAPSQKVGS
jgi:hypothetical protein